MLTIARSLQLELGLGSMVKLLSYWLMDMNKDYVTVIITLALQSLT